MAAASLLSCGAPALQRAWYIPSCVVQCQQLLAQKCQPAFNTIRAAFDLGPKERAVYLRQPVRAASQPHNLYHLAKSTLAFLLDAHNSVGKTIWWVLLRVLCLRKAVPQDTASLQCGILSISSFQQLQSILQHHGHQGGTGAAPSLVMFENKLVRFSYRCPRARGGSSRLERRREGP